jgi:hypothetical protein
MVRIRDIGQQFQAFFLEGAGLVEIREIKAGICERRQRIRPELDVCELLRELVRLESGGFVVDLGSAIEEHRCTARERRSREATETGPNWLFEETLVLPDDFGRRDATEPERVVAESFDFSRVPAIMPPRHRRRPVLK